MASNRPAHSRTAFVWPDIAATLVAGVVIASMLALLGAHTRAAARLGDDFAKLRQLAAATGAYAADNTDQFWTFSWKKGQSLSQWPELNNALTDLQAASNQAVDILRRLADPDTPKHTGWIPHVRYSHLPLLEYLGATIPDAVVVSSGDHCRLAAAADPKGFAANPPPGCGTEGRPKFWPYSASFQLPSAFYDGNAPGDRVSQSPSGHNSYYVPTQAELGGLAVSAAAFPSSKVHLHDQTAWHFPPRVSFFAYDELRLPLLFVDGQVQLQRTGDANPGWRPNQPADPEPTKFFYIPKATEPPTLSGQFGDEVIGRYRWTRGGIQGRDFGGPEVCTGQPGCE